MRNRFSRFDPTMDLEFEIAVLKESESKRFVRLLRLRIRNEQEMHPVHSVPWVLAADKTKDEGGRMKCSSPAGVFRKTTDARKQERVHPSSLALHPN
jgi:hypothetical protein